LVISKTRIAHGIHQGYALGKLAKPGRIVERNAGPRDGEGIFCGVPALRVHIRIGCCADVAECSGAGVGSNGLGNHSRVDRIEFVADVIVSMGDAGCGDEEKGKKDAFH
jgi:hypothetical protein